MTEGKISKPRIVRVGYYSMGMSVIFAGVLILLNQLNYVVAEGIIILWPSMLILLGLETILTQLVVSLKKDKNTMRPAWSIIIICVFLVACSQVYLMLLNAGYATVVI